MKSVQIQSFFWSVFSIFGHFSRSACVTMLTHFSQSIAFQIEIGLLTYTATLTHVFLTSDTFISKTRLKLPKLNKNKETR